MRSYATLLIVAVVLWTLMYFYSLPSLDVYRLRFHSLIHFTTLPNRTASHEANTTSTKTQAIVSTITRTKTPTSPPILAPSPLPASGGNVVIPTVPVMDQLPPRFLGHNRTFNHSYWQIFPVPRLVNFPENGRFLREALKTASRERIYRIGESGGYSAHSAVPFPADCPYQCEFGSGSDATIVGGPDNCPPHGLSFVFGLESSAHSWWGQQRVYDNCAFTMRSNLDSTVPMLGQLKSLLPVDLDRGMLPFESLPWIPYSVKKKRRWVTAMISNCESMRLEIFSKLKDLGISTSQYGGCARGERGEPIPYDELDSLQAGLLGQLKGDRFLEKESLIASSLFHFAAENSLCDFYHTEKLFGALKVGTVPIYFGARTIYPYLPEKSVLFVYDYDNVYDLVRHLKELANNETAYNEYLAWRKKPLAEPLMDLLVVGHGERSAEWQCEMCKLVASTPPGHYEQPYDDCETFPLAEFFDSKFKLPEHVRQHMQKEKPGGRRW